MAHLGNWSFSPDRPTCEGRECRVGTVTVARRRRPARRQPLSDWLGICQWFHYLDFERALLCRRLLRNLGVHHLRMDVSWADYHRRHGPAWYDWLFDLLSEFELLACVWHTPPSLSRNGKSNGPPNHLQLFPEFLWEILERYGRYVAAVELWNEPNNLIKWDAGIDRDWRLFAKMVAFGAGTVALYDKTAVLGVMSPIDGGFIDHLRQQEPEVLKNIDAIGVHAFPGQWNEHGDVWGGWSAVFDHLRHHTDERSVWLTEVGSSTPRLPDELVQAERLYEAVERAAEADRLYWYSLLDLPARYDELEYCIGGYREPLEHSLGLVTADGSKKPGFFVMQELLR
jgi:CDP-paratose 2-epimerase